MIYKILRQPEGRRRQLGDQLLTCGAVRRGEEEMAEEEEEEDADEARPPGLCCG